MRASSRAAMVTAIRVRIRKMRPETKKRDNEEEKDQKRKEFADTGSRYFHDMDFKKPGLRSTGGLYVAKIAHQARNRTTINTCNCKKFLKICPFIGNP